ncbi:MAG: ATP-binding cassette domain-containing protein [Oscillospiraceae bacterium]|nr:ATP-binding cassette domain-containing protein [Oscillospiraceae bacterium]
MNAITVKNLTKKFKEATVLDNISMDFEKGKVHGLIGQNGSGKTMLIKCICGIVPYKIGEIRVNGKIIGKDIDIPTNIGVIIETPGFLPNYSGFNNLKLLANISNKIGKDEIKNAIKSVGLNPDDKQHVGKYSLDMRRRLGLAQAIMEDPEMLILDEPMNGLDKNGVKDMGQYLLDLKAQGKTILIASHSTEDIDVLCDTVCKMDKGKLVKIR